MVQSAFSGCSESARIMFKRYLEPKERDPTSRVDEAAIIDRVLDWRKIGVIICTMDFAIMRPKLCNKKSVVICTMDFAIMRQN